MAELPAFPWAAHPRRRGRRARHGPCPTAALLAEWAYRPQAAMSTASRPGPRSSPFVELGCTVAFGSAATVQQSDDIRDAAAACPLAQIVTETDSPYMAPVPVRGRGECGKPHWPSRPAAWPTSATVSVDARRDLRLPLEQRPPLLAVRRARKPRKRMAPRDRAGCYDKSVDQTHAHDGSTAGSNRVAILFGGTSSEHDISLRSAATSSPSSAVAATTLRSSASRARGDVAQLLPMTQPTSARRRLSSPHDVCPYSSCREWPVPPGPTAHLPHRRGRGASRASRPGRRGRHHAGPARERGHCPAWAVACCRAPCAWTRTPRTRLAAASCSIRVPRVRECSTAVPPRGTCARPLRPAAATPCS